MNINFIFFITFFNLTLLGCLTSQSQHQKTEGIAGRYEIARQLVDAGEYLKAIEMLKSISIERPSFLPAYMLTGSALLGLGDPFGASVAFKKVLEADKTHDDALLSLGYTYIALKDFDGAIKCFEKIINRGSYSKMENVYINFGLAYMESGNCYEAQLYFNKTLQLDPTSVAAHYNNGLCLMKEKNYKSAKYSFQRAVDFCPNCLDPALYLARAKYLSGEKKEARQSVERILRNQTEIIDKKRTNEVLSEFR